MGSQVVAFPAGAAVPDEIMSTDAKDRISDVVKKAAAGGRTTIMSRGYAIAMIGPVDDIPSGALNEATRLPTTEIKSGQTSLKGIIARNDFAVLTIHGQDRAAVYRPHASRQSASIEQKLDRVIGLLESPERLTAFAATLRGEIARALDFLETIDRDKAAALRAQYAALRMR
jgi:antitoxin (DNA-binding transcriptional repressor) of toxin-antitoxin stability system